MNHPKRKRRTRRLTPEEKAHANRPYESAMLDYLQAGWQGVLPLPPAAKYPPPKGYTGHEGRYPTRREIRRFAKEQPDGNVALRPPPDVLGIDVDAYGGKRGDETLHELEDELGELPPTVVSTSRTGASGIRWYQVDPRASWSDAGPDVEVIADSRRYATAPPSIHPKTGKVYRWIDQRTGEECDIPRPEDLPHLPRRWQQRFGSDRQAQYGEPAERRALTTRQIKRFRSALRPGPACTEVLRVPCDLSGNGSRHGGALAASMRLVSLGADGHRGANEALEELGHRFVAAVTPDREGGEKQAREEWQRLLTGAVERVGGQVSARECYCPQDHEMEDWPQPRPLSVALPLFPVDALPSWAARMVEALAEFTQTDPGMAGAYVLAVLAAAAGGRAEVEVRPGWREPANIFVAVVAAPGERKSAVYRTLSAPLFSVERDLVERMKPVIVEAEATREIARKRAEQAQREAGKCHDGDDESLTRAALEAAQYAEDLEVPARPRLVADDATPEVTASLLAEQKGSLAILSSEGGIFETIAGRYHKGHANLDVFLKGHAGDPIRVDRRSRSPEYIDRPALTMGLMLQPSVLQAIARREDFRGRGLLARFLYALPDSRVGHRTVGADPVPDEVIGQYEEGLSTLAATLADWLGDPAVLVLSPEARAVLHDFEEHLEPRLGRSGDLGAAAVTDWGAKAAGAAARLALLLHLADEPRESWRKPIAGSVMTRAVRITGYLTAHAVAAFERMANMEPLDNARYLLHVLKQHAKKDTVSVRDLHTWASRSRFPKKDDIQPALQVLENHGWIVRLPDPEKVGPGRPPSPRYRVHPELIAEAAKSTPGERGP